MQAKNPVLVVLTERGPIFEPLSSPSHSRHPPTSCGSWQVRIASTSPPRATAAAALCLAVPATAPKQQHSIDRSAGFVLQRSIVRDQLRRAHVRRSLGGDACSDEDFCSPDSDSDGGQGSSVRASSQSSEGAVLELTCCGRRALENSCTWVQQFPAISECIFSSSGLILQFPHRAAAAAFRITCRPFTSFPHRIPRNLGGISEKQAASCSVICVKDEGWRATTSPCPPPRSASCSRTLGSAL